MAWMDGQSDDVRRPAAGAGEGRGGGTVRGLRGARVQASRADGQAGRHASRRPKSSQFGSLALYSFIPLFLVLGDS